MSPYHVVIVTERLQPAPAITVSDQSVVVTARMGAAGIMPGQASTLEDLIRRADAALYLAKTAGRDQVSISEPDKPVRDALARRVAMASRS